MTSNDTPATSGTPTTPRVDVDACVRAIQEAALRAAAAGRFQLQTEQRLLQLIVDATSSLFGAKASSIALFERDPDRLEYRAAGGPETAEVVGMSVPPTQGVVGYVYSTGESVALSDLPGDPRFDRTIADKTGYLPNAVAAVPLVINESVVGVIQAFDKGNGESFSVRDMEVLAAFAAQASAAIQGTRVQHDLPLLLVSSLREITPDMTDEELRAVVSKATEGLDADADTPFWALVDQVSRLRDLGESELELVSDILAAVAEHESHRGRFGRRVQR